MRGRGARPQGGMRGVRVQNAINSLLCRLQPRPRSVCGHPAAQRDLYLVTSKGEARSREQGAGSREQSAGSREQGAGSREQSAVSSQQSAASVAGKRCECGTWLACRGS